MLPNLSLIMKALFAVALAYGLFSVFEWLFHRCIMHDSGNSLANYLLERVVAFEGVRERHARHHLWRDVAEPLASNYLNGNNLSAEPQEQWLEKYEGLYFLWPATLGVFLPLVVIYLALNALLFGFPPLVVIFGAMAVVTYQSAMWNSMHPALHGKEDMQLQWHEGIDFIDSRWLQTTPLYRWLWQNHVLHHLAAGSKQGNFNVTAPLADWLFGTYSSGASRFSVDRQTLTVKQRSAEYYEAPQK